MNEVGISEVGALVGDPARANILCALLGGRAWTAKELAYAANVSPQTASGHLAKLTEAGLLVVAPQGRHRYFRLASPQVAQMLESLAAVAVAGPPRYRPPSKVDQVMRRARTCYDHFAGQLGVALSDALCARDFIVLGTDGGEVTSKGEDFFRTFGFDLAAASKKRVFCRPCIDWTERRPHLAGLVGKELTTRCFDLKWVERVPRSRAVILTRLGERKFKDVFGVSLEDA